ncbi:MAG TPA: tyrosine protein kinase, partial [Flavobacterium sp.]|nr:tyrosine protein kinase [Flavobacterium sp.]
PGQEKEYRGIARQQGIKEALYLLLLQKREEMAIALAIKPLSAKIIDEAITSPQPVSPNRQFAYLGALALGLILPFGTIFLINFIDTKI